MKRRGTSMIVTDCAGAGDIVSIAGLSSPSIGHTVTTVEVFTSFHIHASFFIA
jgi:GTP-binding protein